MTTKTTLYRHGGGPPIMDAPDSCGNEAGAWRLAEKIEAYWADRQMAVRAWVERVNNAQGADHGLFFAVRSNMRNGWPTGELTQ